MKNLLCLLGFHKWFYIFQKPSSEVYESRQCARCGKIQDFDPLKTLYGGDYYWANRKEE